MSRPGVLSLQVIARTTALVAILLGFVPFSGATALAVAGGDFPDGLTFGGIQRSYLVHVPPALEQPTGLVINLHGAGMTAAAQAAMTNYNAVADQHGFVVVYPDGIDLSWADGRGASVPDRQGVDDVGFLVALADRLTQDFGIDRGKVFATGMSAGAFMANRLGCARADVFSAIAPVAGTLGSGFPCAASQPVSVLEIHGTADDVVPFNGGPMVGRGGAERHRRRAGDGRAVAGAERLSRTRRGLSGARYPPVHVRRMQRRYRGRVRPDRRRWSHLARRLAGQRAVLRHPRQVTD